MKYLSKKKLLTGAVVLGTLLLSACGKKNNIEKEHIEKCSAVINLIDCSVGTQKLFSLNDVLPITVGEAEKNRITSVLARANFVEYDIHLMAVGDDLMHEGVINSGLMSDGTYNYEALFAGIQPYLDFADIKVINQETIMAGNDNGFSGYPTFNSPVEMADSIANVGFNVVTHATNHTDDMGIAGINYCKNYWDQNHPDVMVIGMYGEEGKNDDIPLLEIEGVTFAMLNYTYGCNWATAQPNLEDHVELLTSFDPSDRYIDFESLNPDVLDDIQRAEQIADVVVVFPHWGIEYQTVENSYQDRVAAEMIDAGADIIIGTHPHVCQPVEWITTENGNTGLCYFSLGNFFSSQYDAPTFIEGMAWVTFHVTSTSVEIVPEETGVLPMVLHYVSPGNKITQTYAIEDYSEELALEHACTVRSGVTLHLSYLESKSQEIFGDYILSVDTIMNGQNNTFNAVGGTTYYESTGLTSLTGSTVTQPSEPSGTAEPAEPSEPSEPSESSEPSETTVPTETPEPEGDRPRFDEEGTPIIYLDEIFGE